MPDEALWAQNAAGYSAEEDRKVFSFVAVAGVVDGLRIAAGTGLTASVSAGHCFVPDGTGGLYAVYITAAQLISGLAASAASNVYVVVDPTSGNWSLAKGPQPSNPSLLIGSVSTNGSTVTAVNNVRAAATSPLELPVEFKRGRTTATTDATGNATFTHALGSVPSWYAAIADSTQYHAHIRSDTLTAQQASVIVRNYSDNAVVPNAAVTFFWRVEV